MPDDRAARLAKSRFFDPKNIPSYYSEKVPAEAAKK
jgi:hypothetical protein